MRDYDLLIGDKIKTILSISGYGGILEQTIVIREGTVGIVKDINPKDKDFFVEWIDDINYNHRPICVTLQKYSDLKYMKCINRKL